jgi:(p)ppGpp synthase/HD superfamily hydrolase
MKTFREFLAEDTISRAFDLAQEKHFYQYRKFSNEPYFTHPSRVADIVARFTKDKDVIAAAYLHDTLEDTKTSYEELDAIFGKKITSLVQELTSVKKDLVKIGKPQYLLNKMQKMSSDALLIKSADRLDNVSDFRKASEKFRKKYIEETYYIIKNLKRSLSSSQKQIFSEIITQLKIWDKWELIK